MKSKLNRIALVLLLTGFYLVGVAQFGNGGGQINPAVNIDIPEILGLYEGERDDGGYFTIVTEDGEVLDKTVRQVYTGDELIVADNRHYRVINIQGDTAIAELVGQRDLSTLDHWGTVDIPVVSTTPVQGDDNDQEAAPDGEAPLIGIYHTHSAESYVPTEGDAFVQAEGEEAKGGIIDVGLVLSNKLEELGFRTNYNSDPHEPHDANAYHRSRRTAAGLLQEGPMLLIDVHRDAVPDPDFYRAELDGETVSKIRLVVGRQNQNMAANLEFAEHLKATADEVHPGLMHAIFMAKGNYNQDLAPKSILIEAGTHVTSREEAERSVAMLADAIAPALGVTPGGAERAPTTGGESRSVLWVIGLSLLAGGAFLLISTGSFSGARDKLRQFVGEEWANTLGKLKEKHKRGNMYQSTINKKAFDIVDKEGAEKMPDKNDKKENK